MLQGKIVNHMLDHTGAIGIVFVPINLIETCTLNLLIENDNKVWSKVDDLLITSSPVFAK